MQIYLWYINIVNNIFNDVKSMEFKIWWQRMNVSKLNLEIKWMYGWVQWILLIKLFLLKKTVLTYKAGLIPSTPTSVASSISIIYTNQYKHFGDMNLFLHTNFEIYVLMMFPIPSCSVCRSPSQIAAQKER